MNAFSLICIIIYQHQTDIASATQCHSASGRREVGGVAKLQVVATVGSVVQRPPFPKMD